MNLSFIFLKNTRVGSRGNDGVYYVEINMLVMILSPHPICPPPITSVSCIHTRLTLSKVVLLVTGGK